MTATAQFLTATRNFLAVFTPLSVAAASF